MLLKWLELYNFNLGFHLCLVLLSIVNICWTDDSQSSQIESSDRLNIETQLLQDLILKINNAHDELNRSVNNYTQDSSLDLKDGDEFDFIIIGSGSAGSVVANRISQNEQFKVLLIEAGGNPTTVSEIPSMYSVFQGSEVDWKYQTAKDGRTCLGLKDEQCALPKGKLLGGCSSTNGMFYVRGNKKDYDNWASQGNNGWSYKKVLKYFKESENLRNKYIKRTKNLMKYHGTDGPLSVDSFNSTHHYLAEYYINAAKEMGYDLLPCVNGEKQTGYTFLSATVEKGKRCSTAKAFLQPIKHRQNFQISKNSMVTKILIDETKKAYGVEMTTKLNQSIKILTKKEIILSAGVFGSPQLLMLSGIGPKQHLKRIGVDVVKDLAVGKNLQDHVAIPIVVGYNTEKGEEGPHQDLLQSYYEFLMKSSGPLTNLGFNSFAGFINITDDQDYPDIQIHHFTFSKNNKKGMETFLNGYGFSEETKKSILDINSQSDTTLIIPTLLRPKSRGEFLLNSKDPFDKPIITSGFLTNTEDETSMLTAIKFVNRFVTTKALSQINAEVKEISVKGCQKEQFQTAEYWKCMLHHVASSLYHTVGTCKMGERDPTAVVHSDLTVRGIDGLRVIDASIMPTIISGNTNAATIMIGEKGADLILQKWK